MANYVSSVDEYIKNITSDILPASDLARMHVTPSGLVRIDRTNSMDWPIELPDSVGAGLYQHEKSSTTRVGILSTQSNSSLNPVYHSYYFKPFYGIFKCFDSLVAQSILEIYPTPVQTYGISYGVTPNESQVFGGVIDLNHLRTKDGHLGVKAIRLDMFLNSLGFNKEITSFLELQTFMKSPKVHSLLSDRAIVQIALESYSIPNAVGEVDSNSRNVIILIDPITGKGEWAARIDAESNTYFNDRNNERSGKKVLPKGIYHGNEFFESEFLPSIQKKSMGIDWDLFTSLANLTEKLTSRNKIDSAIFSGYRRNYARVPFDQVRENSAAHAHFGPYAYSDFSTETIKRANRYNDAVLNAIGKIYHDQMPFGTIDATKPNELEQVPFNSKGKPLTPDEEKFFGLE